MPPIGRSCSPYGGAGGGGGLLSSQAANPLPTLVRGGGGGLLSSQAANPLPTLVGHVETFANGFGIRHLMQ